MSERIESSSPESGWREITEQETELVSRLLASTSQSDALRAQLSNSRVRGIAEYRDEYGSIEFQAAQAPGVSHALVTAFANDADGIPIEILLFTKAGALSELEIVKLDGSKIIRMPLPDEFKIGEPT